MKKIIIILVIALIILVAAVAGLYNSIVSKHEEITAKWAQVENQLQRRNDLIPNLLSTVKGYAAHEKTVFENVTIARSQWAKASTVEEKVNAARSVDTALSRLLLVA
ncbi:MAG: LemA family protein, partial [Candidatus Omnitrophica bacterium]|nr:LemA family protein [Candidatus Omnitrophota bacterium]